jgi:hypothetical protein
VRKETSVCTTFFVRCHFCLLGESERQRRSGVTIKQPYAKVHSSIVGTAFPDCSKSFWKPPAARTGDSLMVLRRTSLFGLKRLSKVCWMTKTCDSPREVENTEAIDVLLVLRRNHHTVDSALDISTGEERKGVTCIDGNGPVLRLDPLPLILDMVTDLQGRDGLAEEQCPRAKVSVSTAP